MRSHRPLRTLHITLTALTLWLHAAGWARAAPRERYGPSDGATVENISGSAEQRLEDRIIDGDVDGDVDAGDLMRASVFAPRQGVIGPTRAGPWLSLVAFSNSSINGTREAGGFALVEVPFDILFARAARTENARPATDERPHFIAWGSPQPSDGGVRVTTLVTPTLARQAIDAAWQAAGFEASDSRLTSAVRRARWSALLPETRLRALHADDQRLYADATVDSASTRLRDTSGANIALEARLTWRLDRVLYADDEASFERIRLEHHAARTRLATRVLETLFHWHRAALDVWDIRNARENASAEARDPRTRSTRPSREETDALVRLTETETALDVLTGGWFSKAKPQLGALL